MFHPIVESLKVGIYLLKDIKYILIALRKKMQKLLWKLVTTFQLFHCEILPQYRKSRNKKCCGLHVETWYFIRGTGGLMVCKIIIDLLGKSCRSRFFNWQIRCFRTNPGFSQLNISKCIIQQKQTPMMIGCSRKRDERVRSKANKFCT